MTGSESETADAMSDAPRVLVADPPWKFNDSLPGARRGASKNYSTMAIHAVLRFAIPEMGSDSILFLWRVSAMPSEALSVCEAWGYTPKTELVWIKTASSDPRRIRIGMGHYVRAAHETCLVATRGRVKVRDRSVPSVFFAERPKRHSEKPEEFYKIVERLVEGPYVELFARKRRAGWEQFGDQLEPEAST